MDGSLSGHAITEATFGLTAMSTRRSVVRWSQTSRWIISAAIVVA